MDGKLRLSNTDKKVFGVLGGIGEYFDIPPVALRVVLFLLTLKYGWLFYGYILLAVLLPKAVEGNGVPKDRIRQTSEPADIGYKSLAREALERTNVPRVNKPEVKIPDLTTPAHSRPEVSIPDLTIPKVVKPEVVSKEDDRLAKLAAIEKWKNRDSKLVPKREVDRDIDIREMKLF